MAVSENKILKKVYVNLDLENSLKNLASISHLTESEIIRIALEKYLMEKTVEAKGDKDNFLLSMAGLGKNGPNDGAKNHDKYIYGRK